MLPTFLLVYDGLRRLLCSKNNLGTAKEHFDFSPEDKEQELIIGPEKSYKT